MRRAVFLDKDGTLIVDDPPNTDISRVRFHSDVFTALRVLAQAGYMLVIVTNQDGIAHGRCQESDVRRMQTYIQHRFADEGITLAGFYFCPHHADGIVAPYAVTCRCRKPQPGLLIRASRELHIDLTQSWMIGDILHDVEAGRGAGCRTVLMDMGNETEWRLTESRWPHHIADSLLSAATFIVSPGRRTHGAIVDRGMAEP